MIKKKYGKMFAVHCNSIALPYAKHCMVSREPLHVMCEEK